MTIREMEIFTEVARTMNMSAASKNLYVSQSTVSQAILAVERQYDVRLFQRLSKRLVLTPQGEAMLRYCTQILALHQSMESELKYSSGKAVRIGTTLIAARSIFTPIWRRYHLECPDVITHIAVESGDLLTLKLQNYELDLAITDEEPRHPDLVSREIGSDDFLLICRPGSFPAEQDSLPLAELAGHTLLMQKEGTPTRDLLDRAAKEAGVALTVREYGNIDIIKEKVAAGEGISVMARRLAEPEQAEGVLQTLSIPDLPVRRRFYAVHHRQLHQSPDIRALLEICRESE